MKEELIILSQQAEASGKYFIGVISFDTLSTVFTTIFIFFLGVFFQKWLEEYKRRIKLKSIKENFLYMIEVLPVRYITPHINRLKEFYLESNTDTGFAILPPITISGDLKRLSEYSSNDLFSAFRALTKHHFEKDLHNILSLVDYLVEQTMILNRYHKSILLRNNELRNEIQNLIEEYLDYIAKTIRDIKESDENYSKNPFWIYINKMLMDYYNEPNRKNTISFFYKKMLRPMQLELVSQEYDRKIKEAEKITFIGKKITTRIFYLKNETVSVRLQYRQFFKETSNLLNDFNKLSATLKKSENG